MNNTKPSSSALRNALNLSIELLRNIELQELPLASITLRASRLARLVNDFDHQNIFAFEAGGYPTTPNGVQPHIWKLAEMAGRTYDTKDSNGEIKKVIFIESIENLEEQISTCKLGLSAAQDADISIASANPRQYISAPAGNALERMKLLKNLKEASERLSGRRSYIYQYVLYKNYELSFSNIASDVFSRIRDRVDSKIGIILPATIQKFSAVHESLQSENPENWASSVHSCRRILQDLADAVFPAQSEPRQKGVGKHAKSINLGPDNYINRILAFVEDNAESERFEAIVGSHLRFLGERLDATFQATQKGSHSTIATRDEADRYVVYTYMIVADVLSLMNSSIHETEIAKLG